MMAKPPDRLDIDKADRELYDHDTINSEILTGTTRKEQFLFAMSIGFKNQVKRPLDVGEGFFLAKDMSPEDEALIDAVAIYDTGSADVLSDRRAVFRIAEEYAHAGIRLLYDRATSGQPGSFYKKLEVELFNLLEALDSN
jgi:hypothetical protein